MLYKALALYYVENDYCRLINKLKKMVYGVDGNFPYIKLKSVFRTSRRYEYKFWDAMYNMEH